MVKRLEFTDSSRTSSSLSTSKLDAKASEWIATHARMLHASGAYYKFVGTNYRRDNLVSVKKIFIESKDATPDFDKAFIVELGGLFQKVGDDNEVIGGGNQKVGSAD